VLQTLADIDWLLYLSSISSIQHQQQKLSVVDELFALQLLTGRLCVACHQLSVSIQVFLY